MDWNCSALGMQSTRWETRTIDWYSASTTAAVVVAVVVVVVVMVVREEEEEEEDDDAVAVAATIFVAQWGRFLVVDSILGVVVI